nr:hypothetical protein [uncultured Rhodoferax sp.]
MNLHEAPPRLPQVVLKFSGLDYYPSELVMAGLELVEQALHELEEDALKQTLAEHGLLESLYAVRAEMDKMRRRHLQLYDASRGCLELWGVAGATALWVLQLTVGESMKDAYKKSDMHRTLSEIFSRDVVKFAEQLSTNIKKTIGNAKRNSAFVVALSRVDVNVHVHERQHEETKVMVILNATKSYESVPQNILRPR